MKSKEVIAFFGGQVETARAIGISAPAVCQWKEDVPASRLKNVELAMAAEQAKRDKEAKRMARAQAKLLASA